MEPAGDPQFISAFDNLEDDQERRGPVKRPSDPNIDVPDTDFAGTKKHDTKSTPHWVAASSPAAYGAGIEGEMVLRQQREFVANVQAYSPVSVSGASGADAGSSGRVSPASFENYAPGTHDTVVERRTTRTRNRSRSRTRREGGARTGGRWTSEEEEKLKEAHEALGDDWQAIAEHYFGNRDGRTADHCQARWEKVLERGLIKGPWKEEEDRIIVECIERGMAKWSDIAKHVPGRVGKQCRERWHNHLDPQLKKTPWDEEEDAILIHAQRKWGNLWTKIARLIPGRSENQVKNRWHAATRRRPLSASDSDGYSSSRDLDDYPARNSKATPLCTHMLHMLDQQKQTPRQMPQDRGSVNTTSLLLVDVDYADAQAILMAARNTVAQNRLRVPSAEGTPPGSQSRRILQSRDPSPSIDESELPPALTMTAHLTPGIPRFQQNRPSHLVRPDSASLYSTSPSPTASSISTYSYSSDHSPEARDDDEIDFGLPQQLEAFKGLGNPALPLGLHRSTTPDHSLEPQYSGDHFQAGRSSSWPTPPPQPDNMGMMPPSHPHHLQTQHSSDLSWHRLIDAAQRFQNSGAHHHPSQPPQQYDMQQQQQQQQQGGVFSGGAGAQTMAFPYQQHGGHHHHLGTTQPAFPYMEQQHTQQHQLHGFPQPYQPTNQGFIPSQPQYSTLGPPSFPNAGESDSTFSELPADLQELLNYELINSGRGEPAFEADFLSGEF